MGLGGPSHGNYEGFVWQILGQEKIPPQPEIPSVSVTNQSQLESKKHQNLGKAACRCQSHRSTDPSWRKMRDWYRTKSGTVNLVQPLLYWLLLPCLSMDSYSSPCPLNVEVFQGSVPNLSSLLVIHECLISSSNLKLFRTTIYCHLS